MSEEDDYREYERESAPEKTSTGSTSRSKRRWKPSANGWQPGARARGGEMNHKNCMACAHTSTLFSDAPCNECNSNDEPVRARFWSNKNERETGDKWEPNELAQSLIALGRRNGLEEAYKIASEQSLQTLRMKLEEALEVK